MSAELPKLDRNSLDSNSAGVAVPYSPLREMLGYDPFRRFFSNVDPQIDVIRTDAGFEVEIPVPGFKTDQIELIVKENVLTLTGKHERRAFTRSLKLPEDVDSEKHRGERRQRASNPRSQTASGRTTATDRNQGARIAL